MADCACWQHCCLVLFLKTHMEVSSSHTVYSIINKPTLCVRLLPGEVAPGPAESLVQADGAQLISLLELVSLPTLCDPEIKEWCRLPMPSRLILTLMCFPWSLSLGAVNVIGSAHCGGKWIDPRPD